MPEPKNTKFYLDSSQFKLINSAFNHSATSQYFIAEGVEQCLDLAKEFLERQGEADLFPYLVKFIELRAEGIVDLKNQNKQ